jgi:LCP family protein required for cell wall assembly
MKTWGWRAGLTIGAKTVAALLSLAVVLTTGYAWASYRTFESNVINIQAIVPVTPEQKKQDVDGADQNILLVGNDDRTGATATELAQMHTGTDDGAVNTDTMVLLHVPANGAKATGISFPRDSWVTIPGHGKGKLNSAYELGTENGGGAKGGAQLLIATIKLLTGLSIDHYVAVSMLSFLRIAKVLGPINVCLNQATQDDYSGADFKAGQQTLQPAQALAFVRQRHGLLNGDLDREIRQQYFLSAEFRKLASAKTLANPLKTQKLLSTVGKSIVKDTGLDLLRLAAQLQNLTSGNLKFAPLPITGTPDIYPNGVKISIVAVNYPAIPAFVAGIIGKSNAAKTPAASASASASSSASKSATASASASASASAGSTARSFSSTDCIN